MQWCGRPAPPRVALGKIGGFHKIDMMPPRCRHSPPVQWQNLKKAYCHDPSPAPFRVIPPAVAGWSGTGGAADGAGLQGIAGAWGCAGKCCTEPDAPLLGGVARIRTHHRPAAFGPRQPPFNQGADTPSFAKELPLSCVLHHFLRPAA